MVGNVVANSLKLHNLLLFIVFITHKFREESDILAVGGRKIYVVY